MIRNRGGGDNDTLPYRDEAEGRHAARMAQPVSERPSPTTTTRQENEPGDKGRDDGRDQAGHGRRDGRGPPEKVCARET